MQEGAHSLSAARNSSLDLFPALPTLPSTNHKALLFSVLHTLPLCGHPQPCRTLTMLSLLLPSHVFLTCFRNE